MQKQFLSRRDLGGRPLFSQISIHTYVSSRAWKVILPKSPHLYIVLSQADSLRPASIAVSSVLSQLFSYRGSASIAGQAAWGSWIQRLGRHGGSFCGLPALCCRQSAGIGHSRHRDLSRVEAGIVHQQLHHSHCARGRELPVGAELRRYGSAGRRSSLRREAPGH